MSHLFMSLRLLHRLRRMTREEIRWRARAAARTVAMGIVPP
jgi:hypothetical protein